jgi:hypothetical protein
MKTPLPHHPDRPFCPQNHSIDTVLHRWYLRPPLTLPQNQNLDLNRDSMRTRNPNHRNQISQLGRRGRNHRRINGYPSPCCSVWRPSGAHASASCSIPKPDETAVIPVRLRLSMASRRSTYCNNDTAHRIGVRGL